MSRMRTVKPEFFRSATIGKLSRDARLLFIGMWTEADDEGRGLAEARHLAGTLFPFDRGVTEKKIDRWLAELGDVACSDGACGLIQLYEANGTRYYSIRSWWHQKINKPGPPRYPAPPPLPEDDPPEGESHSRNGAPQTDELEESHSRNRTRQGSGVRSQGSGNRVQGSGHSSRKPDLRSHAPEDDPSPVHPMLGELKADLEAKRDRRREAG